MNDGKGHPLPASDEAHHDQIPESLEAEKGEGDDAREASTHRTVNPDGTPYGDGEVAGGSGTDGTVAA